LLTRTDFPYYSLGIGPSMSQPSKPAAETPHIPNLIYVVDDEPMIGAVVEVILKLEGFEARLFSNPHEALKVFAQAQTKPALLLTDFLMSPINGMELIQNCKKLDPELKTLLYSGNVREDILEYYPIKPDGFLSKPFLPKNLVGAVQNILGVC